MAVGNDIIPHKNGMEHSSKLPAAVSLPREIIYKYEEFISKNASSVSQIESTLRSLTYIIPVHSGIQLLSLYHDSLLARVFSRLPASIPRPLPSAHNRYTKFWAGKSSLYKNVAILLQTLNYTELLWEMAAKRKGEKTRWRIVIILELFKAFCRFILMRLTNSRPLVNPPLPEREADPRGTEDENAGTDGHITPAVSEVGSEYSTSSWMMPRTGLPLPLLPDSTEITDFLMKKVLTADDIKAPKQLLHRLTSYQGQLAELAWTFRPVVYALLLRHYALNVPNSKGKAAWMPWLVGAGMDVAARQLAKNDLQQRVAGGLRGLSKLEREEMTRRGWGMSWWLMRGAFYENVTRGWITGITNSLKGKMLLDMVGGIIEDYEYLWDQYYFATSST